MCDSALTAPLNVPPFAIKNRRPYKINIDDLFSALFQLMRAKSEPNNLEVVDFGKEKKKRAAM